ncbi:oligosaccharide flippase family protein [Anaerobacillus sp. HL2]|nr:oligosaccharide flippase family protein [Anaerobacillus sp. HL2]
MRDLSFNLFFIVNGYGPYVAGTGAAVASILGGIIGFCVLFFFYQKQKCIESKAASSPNKSVAITIITQGIMICFSSLLLLIFQFIDLITVLRILLDNGLALEAAKIAKGIFDRGHPLVQMGTVITTLLF